MEKRNLGKTGLKVSKIGFGVLPLQRTEIDEAVRILKRAYEAGIDFYDTARAYTDSEIKIGAALADVRSDIIIASKVTGAADGRQVTEYIENSLRQLKTDYVDIMQFHNTGFVPRPDGEDGMYEAMLKAKEQGKIRFIGFTNHKISLAKEALLSGLYSTVQYPFSYLSSKEELNLLTLAEREQVGMLAMKPLGGGLLNNAAAVYYFFEQHKNLLPLYGIQHMKELEEFLELEKNPPDVEKARSKIERDRQEMEKEFCRGCGYCLPCPAGIRLEMVCRMSLLLKRASLSEFLTREWYDEMQKTKDCIECGQCQPRCPYDFKPQTRLAQQYEDFMEMYEKYYTDSR